MSKFIDMLEKVGQLAPTPMGFGAATRRNNAAPQMAVVGLVRPQSARDVSDAQVDAFLVSLDSWDEGLLEQASDALGERLWGARVSGLSKEQAASLKEKGCDFIVFDAEGTAAAVLNDEEMGKVLAIGGALDEETARAIQDMPIDAVLFTPGKEMVPLTVQRLIDIQQVRCMVDKSFLMAAPAALTPDDLEGLRNAGITGLLVEVPSADAVAGLKQSIEGLPRRKPRSVSREAIAPRAPVGFDTARREEEEEEDDDEEDF